MGVSEKGKWRRKWFYWMDVTRMILLNLQMVLLHVNAGPNSLEASVNNWKLCIFQMWCIVKFLCCGWSPSSGISQTGFKSWLASKKTCSTSPQKTAGHQPVVVVRSTWGSGRVWGFSRPVWLGFLLRAKPWGWGQSSWSFIFEKNISVYEDLFITVSLVDGYSSCFTCVF